jgi:hypothetical protein
VQNGKLFVIYFRRFIQYFISFASFFVIFVGNANECDALCPVMSVEQVFVLFGIRVCK